MQTHSYIHVIHVPMWITDCFEWPQHLDDSIPCDRFGLWNGMDVLLMETSFTAALTNSVRKLQKYAGEKQRF